MDKARWERVQAVFHGAADLSPADQAAYLEAECGRDLELIAEVRALLVEDARPSILDRGVARVAHEVLGAGVPQSLASERFGPYRIKDVLGEGGMGVVYLAQREDLGSVAAIKILRDAWLSPARRERFAAEQRMLAQLNHPSIARLYDANALPDGTPWFVMEYVEGVPITEYCRSHAASVPERLRLFREVCEAVQHAHLNLVVHRDLKPSNILVRPDGTVKLLDFGISKQLGGVDAPIDQTRTGLRLMTPAYAAPEQIRGDRIGIHTDVYSLGVVLYELLAGKLPFDLSSRTPGEAETIIVEQEPEKPSAMARRAAESGGDPLYRSVRKPSWGDLDVLCLTAMHKDPPRRYRTVDALVRDIDHYLKGEPLEARPDSLRYRAGKFVRRNWKPVSTAAAVFLLIVALSVFYTVRLTTARNEALAEAARTQRIQRFTMNLFQGGDETAGPAESLRVVTLVDRGLKEARSLDAEPAVQAELFQTLGSIYQQLGKFSRADSLLQASLAERRKLVGPDHPDVVASLVALGALRDAQASYDEAERLIRQALETSKRHLPPGHPEIAKATAALGKVLEDRGSYNDAIPVLEESVRLTATDTGLTPDYRASLTELANTHFYAGHYDVSDSLNRVVLKLDRRAYGDRHANIADDLINLGAIQFERGNYSEAERLQREALVIVRAWYGENHPETASTLTMVGRALVSQGRLDEAVAPLEEGLRINESFYGRVHPRVASTLNELGRLAQQRGKLDEAEGDFRRMAEIYKEIYHDKHYLIGIALSNLAGVYYARKDYATAEQLFREVVRRYHDVLSDDHQLVGIARIRLGRTLLGARRFKDAESESRAGYDILMKLASPSVTWLKYAREDLATVYDSLREKQKASRFRAELADAEKKIADSKTK